MGALAPRAPPNRRKVAVLSHAEYVPTVTAAAALSGLVTLTFDFESGVTCDVGYLCANFVLGLSVLDLGPVYATDVSQKHRFAPIRGGAWCQPGSVSRKGRRHSLRRPYEVLFDLLPGSSQFAG